MNLIEKFFGEIIPVKLDKPVLADLLSQGSSESIPSIVIPTIDADGRAVLDFYANLDVGMALGVFQNPSAATVRFNNGCTVEGFLKSRTLGLTTGRVEGRILFAKQEYALRSCYLKHALFGLKDFPLFLGQDAAYIQTTYDADFPEYKGGRLLGRSKIEAGDWEIVISECPDKEVSGFTHTGYVGRCDGKLFSVADLANLLDGLNYFFSFVTGVYRTPAVVIGCDRRGSSVWGRIADFNQSKYRVGNWFDIHHGESIADLFPLFWEHFNHDGEKIRNIIGCYAESSMIAHIGLFKTALNDSQIALEGLARWSLGREKGGQPAAAYIKEGLESLNINPGLSEFPHLLSIWQNYKGDSDEESGPAFITRLRNKYTHPKFQEMEVSDYYYAWQLSQAYVELMLLRLSGYTGSYRCRVTAQWVGEVRQVPGSEPDC